MASVIKLRVLTVCFAAGRAPKAEANGSLVPKGSTVEVVEEDVALLKKSESLKGSPFDEAEEKPPPPPF